MTQYKIEMLVTTHKDIDTYTLETELLNCLMGLENKRILQTGTSWLRTAQAKD